METKFYQRIIKKTVLTMALIVTSLGLYAQKEKGITLESGQVEMDGGLFKDGKITKINSTDFYFQFSVSYLTNERKYECIYVEIYKYIDWVNITVDGRLCDGKIPSGRNGMNIVCEDLSLDFETTYKILIFYKKEGDEEKSEATYAAKKFTINTDGTVKWVR